MSATFDLAIEIERQNFKKMLDRIYEISGERNFLNINHAEITKLNEDMKEKLKLIFLLKEQNGTYSRALL